MSWKIDRKHPRFSLREKLLLVGIALLFLVVIVLGTLTALTVLARGPEPKPTPVPVPVPLAPIVATSVPTHAPSIWVSPQEVEPGRLVILAGEGWTPGDEVAVHVIAPCRDEWPVAQTIVGQDGAFVAPFIFPVELGSSVGSSVVVSASSGATGLRMSLLLSVLPGEQASSPLPTTVPIPALPATPSPTASPDEMRAAVPSATSTPVPIVQGWRGEYWSNRSLSGTPALVRNDGRLDFSWGWGSPAAGLPNDGFSARWTRTAHFEAATYRFYLLVDDGARLYVDNRLILDAWNDGAMREVRKDLLLTRGAHDLRAEYYEQAGEASIRVRWEQVTTSFPDWRGEYWSNRKLEGKPVLIRNDKRIDFQWGAEAAGRGLSPDNFSARWSRKVTFDRGVYRFYAWADDGIRIYLDGELALNEWRDSSGEEVYTVDLELAGQKMVVVEYYDRGGQALAKVWWKRVGDWPTPAPTATASSTPEPMATPTATPEPTATPTATPEPTSEPGLSSVRLNELLPVPVQDGVVDELDEWIELYNAGSVALDLTGWLLDDAEGGSDPYRIPEGTGLLPGAFALFHGRTTGLVLDDNGDMVELIDRDGAVLDSVAFGELPPNASYSRDDAGIWHDDWQPSPGMPNQPPPRSARVYPGQWLLESLIVLGLFGR